MRRAVGPGIWVDEGPSNPGHGPSTGEVVIGATTMGGMAPYATRGGLPLAIRQSPWRREAAVPGVIPLPPKEPKP